MDLYDDSFKLQDMIDSDIRSLRTELDELLSSDLPRSPESPTLTALTPVVPMDLLESTLDSELSDDGGTGWMNSSQMYNLSTDLDSIGGLLVNPQTALPVTVIQSHVSTPVVTTISGGMDVTLTPSQTHLTPAAMVTTNSGHTVTLPVQVITTTATLVSQVDQGEPQVNFTVAVPTPSPSPHHVSQQATTTHVHQLLSLQQVPQQQEQEGDGSPKPKPKSKLATKIPLQKSQDNAYPKPAYSYSCLIAMALKNSKTGSLPVNEIYDFMTENFPYFKTAPNGWKNSVRHNLSLNKCFEKIEKPAGNGAQRKGYLWAMNPAKVEKMEEELQKWGSKDPVAIRKSMANPERLELIEKGELKNSDSDVKQSEKPVEEKESQVKCAKHSENETAVESLSTELSNSNFSPLGETVSMDSSLPELDLQKGIWENLCEDRLQFLSDSPISSSSPKQSEALCNTSVTLDDDSSPVSSPSTLTRSFVHANYIYTYAQCTPQSESASSHQLLQHSNVTATGTEKSTTICDA